MVIIVWEKKVDTLIIWVRVKNGGRKDRKKHDLGYKAAKGGR